MENIKNLISEGTEDQIISVLEVEHGDRAEYARLLIHQGLRHLVYPVFCDPNTEMFTELIASRDSNIIKGLVVDFEWGYSEFCDTFWDNIINVQKTGDLELFKYFIATIRFTELAGSRFDGPFAFKDDSEIQAEECSMEFEEMEKFLNLANECINDGHAENLKFLQLIRFRIEIDGEYFVCSLSNSGKTLGNKYAADHDKYYYMLKDSVLTKVDGEWNQSE